MTSTAVFVQALILILSIPLLAWFWRAIAQKDSDVSGGDWAIIWIPISGVGSIMAIVLCSVLAGAEVGPEMALPLSLGAYFGIFPFALAIARMAGAGRTRLGRRLGIHPPTPQGR